MSRNAFLDISVVVDREKVNFTNKINENRYNNDFFFAVVIRKKRFTSEEKFGGLEEL